MMKAARRGWAGEERTDWCGSKPGPEEPWRVWPSEPFSIKMHPNPWSCAALGVSGGSERLTGSGRLGVRTQRGAGGGSRV